MILLFGGTTEGRRAIEVLEAAGKPYYYSTKSAEQQVQTLHGKRISGAMSAKEIANFCQEQEIALLVDAAHPFAEELHSNIAEAAEQLQLEVIRYERIYPPRAKDIVWCKDYQSASDRMLDDGVQKLLMLTGLNTIAKLKPYWSQRESYCRILDRPSSIEAAIAQGYPKERLRFFKEGDDENLLRELMPDAIISKESGESGFFDEKIEAARRLGIGIYVVERPALSPHFIPVNGPVGLRLKIQELLPQYFPQRMGLSTGSTATAATVAALELLLHGKRLDRACFELPSGESVSLPIESLSIEQGKASARVLKNAGDDPDVTDGIEIEVSLRLCPEHGEIRFEGGEGVGRVTKPGLGIAIGDAAINANPRAMISHEIRKRYPAGGIELCIAVPKGRELARKTFNPRLGIEGGISIIGTTGVVKPFSSEAFVASIRQQINVAVAGGAKELVINSGGKSESYLRQYFEQIPSHSFVQYGNFVGETLSAIAEYKEIERVHLGIMIGKAVKLAEGKLDTHSKHTVMNKGFLISMAKKAGCTEACQQVIAEMNLARQLWNELDKADLDKLMHALCQACHEASKRLVHKAHLRLILINEVGEMAYQYSDVC